MIERLVVTLTVIFTNADRKPVYNNGYCPLPKRTALSLPKDFRYSDIVCFCNL